MHWFGEDEREAPVLLAALEQREIMLTGNSLLSMIDTVTGGLARDSLELLGGEDNRSNLFDLLHDTPLSIGADCLMPVC